MRQYRVLILVFFFGTASVKGAESQKYDSINRGSPINFSAWYHYGFLFPHHRSMAYFTSDYINGFEVAGSAWLPWINEKRPPEFGAGYYYSNLGNRDVYGWIHGFYISIGEDFFRNRFPVYIQQTTSFGISYNTERFDIDENYSNRAIGSHFNAFVILSVNLRAELGDHLILSAGPSIVHASNGNIRHPNFGMNLVNNRVGITYKFNSDNERLGAQSYEPEPYTKDNLIVLASGGIRQLSRKIPDYFVVGSLVTEYSRRLSRYNSFGVGLDLVFDATEGRETYVTEKRVEHIVPWHIGVHLCYERHWNRFSISLQPGYKIITLSEHDFYQFNRAALRYRINRGVILNCAIKTHQFRADFIEFGVGMMVGR